MTTSHRRTAFALAAALSASSATLAGPVVSATAPAPASPDALADPCAEGLRLLRRADFLALRELGAPRFGLIAAPTGAAARAYGQAAAAFTAVIARRPDLADAYVHLVACHRGSGRFDLARATLEPLRRLDPAAAARLAADLADIEARSTAAGNRDGC